MLKSLRVLHLEDNLDDAELVLHQLRRDGLAPIYQRVETQADYLSCLDDLYDIILADYSLPQFNAPQALELLQNKGLDIPFVVVSGAIGDEQAVECMKQGAADYLLKDRLTGLGQVVEHALEAKRLRDEKRQSDAQVRKLSRAVEQSPVSIVITDPSGNIEYVNPRFCLTTGYSLEDVRGCHTRLLQSGEIPKDCFDDLWVCIRAGREWRGALLNRKKNGDFIWESVSISPIFDEANEITNYVATYEDITAHKRAEAAMIASQERLYAFMDNTPAVVFIKDEEGRYVYLNRAVEQVTAAPVSSLLGKTNYDRLPLETAKQLRANDLKVLETGQALQFEETLPGPDGRIRHELVVKFPLPGPDGRQFLAGVAVDITHLKRAQAQLNQEESSSL